MRNRQVGPPDPHRRIELTADDLQQIGIAWEAQGRATPSALEMRALIEARVREEILYREALALGLDQNDAIVRRRLAQKMESLFEDVAQLRETTTDELRMWFAANRERFTLPARITFRHLDFSPDRRGDRTREVQEPWPRSPLPATPLRRSRAPILSCFRTRTPTVRPKGRTSAPRLQRRG